MRNIAIIGASGGIGRAATELLIADDSCTKIYAISRSGNVPIHKKITGVQADITDEVQIHQVVQAIDVPLHGILCTVGILHDKAHNTMPEKSLRDLDADALATTFMVNTIGVSLVMKHFLPLVPKNEASVFAALSARVGSISDNQLGGWYGYRASKAALNMMIKCAAIEMARKYKYASIISLHPGTVDTGLSKPFQTHVKHDIFTPQQSAHHMLRVMRNVTPEQSGLCFAWDGSIITP